MFKSLTHLTILLVGCLLSSPVFAYLDPGSGSGLLSIIIGFFVAIGLTIKTYWYKIKSLFKRTQNVDQSMNPVTSNTGQSESSSDQP